MMSLREIVTITPLTRMREIVKSRIIRDNHEALQFMMSLSTNQLRLFFTYKSWRKTRHFTKRESSERTSVFTAINSTSPPLQLASIQPRLYNYRSPQKNFRFLNLPIAFLNFSPVNF